MDVGRKRRALRAEGEVQMIYILFPEETMTMLERTTTTTTTTTTMMMMTTTYLIEAWKKRERKSSARTR